MNIINELKSGHHLNCNEFSVYDFESLSMQELLSTFYTKINECIKSANDMGQVAEWLVKEGLTIEVAKKLIEWVEDGTLKNIINKEIFDDLHKSISYFDLAQNPVLYTGVKGKETSVMQDIHILKNNNILISQVASSTIAETESFTITQCTVKGDIINYMTVKNGGHGNFTVYENKCGNIFILFCDNNDTFRKIEYIAGTYDVEDAEILFKATTERAYPKANNDKNILALTMKNNQGEYYCTDIYDLEKYMKGESFKSLKHVEHGQIGTFQGSGVDETKLYLYYGYVNAIIQIVEIDLETYERTEHEYPRIVNATNSENTTTEAEGMCIANNQLYIGVALGEPTILRENCVYTFLPVNKLMGTLNTVLNNVQMYKLTEASGTAKSFKHGNILANITSPGEYYFTTVQFAEIQDVPDYVRSIGSGFYLSVSARAKDGSVIQTLKRNTAGNNRLCLERSIMIDGTASQWVNTHMERDFILDKDTRTVDVIELPVSIFDFDFINVHVWSPTGKATTDLLFCEELKKTKKMVFSGINLGDSGTSTTLYAWELHVDISEDGRTLTQSKKTQLSIANGGNATASNCEVGLCYIHGIRGFMNI